MVVQTVRDGRKIAARKQVFDALQEGRVDGQRVGEGAVEWTGLLNYDLAIALLDVGADLPGVIVDEGFDRLLTGQNTLARNLDTFRTE